MLNAKVRYHTKLAFLFCFFCPRKRGGVMGKGRHGADILLFSHEQNASSQSPELGKVKSPSSCGTRAGESWAVKNQQTLPLFFF